MLFQTALILFLFSAQIFDFVRDNPLANDEGVNVVTIVFNQYADTVHEDMLKATPYQPSDPNYPVFEDSFKTGWIGGYATGSIAASWAGSEIVQAIRNINIVTRLSKVKILTEVNLLKLRPASGMLLGGEAKIAPVYRFTNIYRSIDFPSYQKYLSRGMGSNLLSVKSAAGIGRDLYTTLTAVEEAALNSKWARILKINAVKATDFINNIDDISSQALKKWTAIDNPNIADSVFRPSTRSPLTGYASWQEARKVINDVDLLLQNQNTIDNVVDLLEDFGKQNNRGQLVEVQANAKQIRLGRTVKAVRVKIDENVQGLRSLEIDDLDFNPSTGKDFVGYTKEAKDVHNLPPAELNRWLNEKLVDPVERTIEKIDQNKLVNWGDFKEHRFRVSQAALDNQNFREKVLTKFNEIKQRHPDHDFYLESWEG